MDDVRDNRLPLVLPGGMEHHVADLSCAFAADVTLAQAQEKLAQAGQWLPIDGDPCRTLGELVECNSTGPLRLGYGAWRDLLLGAQFTNGAGELITAGGRVVKNVAGYDLTKFMVGQFGIFGNIVTITTRTYRRPTHALLATFGPDVKTLNAMLITRCRPQWSLLDAKQLICGYVGEESALDFYQAELPKLLPTDVRRLTIEEDISTRADLWNTNAAGMSYRASVPPSRLSEFVGAAGLEAWIADAAFGVVIGSCAGSDGKRLQTAAADVGGSVTLFNDGRPMNGATEESQRKLLDRLKYAFDPDGKLKPLPDTP